MLGCSGRRLKRTGCTRLADLDFSVTAAVFDTIGRSCIISAIGLWRVDLWVGVGVRDAAKWAATWQSLVVVVGPTLGLKRRSIGDSVQVLIELVARRSLVVAVGRSSRRESNLTPSLGGVLVLGGAKLTSCMSLLLQGLLLLCIGIADLNLRLFDVLIDVLVAKALDDLLAGITVLESGRNFSQAPRIEWRAPIPSKADTTTMAILVSKDTGGADLVWREEIRKLMLIHALWKVGDVEIGVLLVCEGLELRVERLLASC